MNVSDSTITYSTMMDDEKPHVSGTYHREGRITWNQSCHKNIWIKGKLQVTFAIAYLSPLILLICNAWVLL